MLTLLKSSSLVPVMISSMYLPVCNRFHDRRAIRSKITTFWGYPSLNPACTGHFEHRRSGLGLLKIRLMLKKIHTQVVLVYIQPFGHNNSVLNCVAVRNRQKKSLKLFFEWSVSTKVTDVDSPKKLLTRACYDKQHVCAYLQPFLC